MKKLIRKILREEINKSDKHYSILDKITDHVHLPYFESMEGLTIYEKDDQEYIMRKLLGNIYILRSTMNMLFMMIMVIEYIMNNLLVIGRKLNGMIMVICYIMKLLKVI